MCIAGARSRDAYRMTSLSMLTIRSRCVSSRAMWKRLQVLAADPGAMRIYESSEIKF